MGKKKKGDLAVCNGYSTTHKDFELAWHYIIGQGDRKQIGIHNVPYFEVPLPFERFAAAVFKGHANSTARMRAVFKHMHEARTRDGSFCTDLIPMKGRSQGSERMFCERKDQEDLLLAFSELDKNKNVQGLSQALQRRNTEAVRDRQQFLVLKTASLNAGDFEGYRLAGNAVDEIDRDGDVRPATAAAIASYFGAMS